MQDLNDLYYFAAVVDHGGFAAAERALGIPKSRLSRRISALETELGVRLLQRSTRRFAVTDVGTFLPIAVAVWATIRAYERGRWYHYVIGGAAVGIAIGFKYTAGLAILPLILAAALRFFRDREAPLLKRRDLWWIVAAGAAMVAAFALTTPYFFVKPVSALYQLKQQSEAAGDSVKLGQEQQGGFSFYLESFTWGLGWAAFIFAIIGAFFEFRRDRWRGLLLITYPVLLFAYMGIQTRYFGRWLLPCYPALALGTRQTAQRLAQQKTAARSRKQTSNAMVRCRRALPGQPLQNRLQMRMQPIQQRHLPRIEVATPSAAIGSDGGNQLVQNRLQHPPKAGHVAHAVQPQQQRLHADVLGLRPVRLLVTRQPFLRLRKLRLRVRIAVKFHRDTPPSHALSAGSYSVFCRACCYPVLG